MAQVDDREFATEVARDLRDQVYGDRLDRVLLYGSRARGDHHTDSDLDLLVVLTEMDSLWHELDLMDALLWRHTLASDIAVMALPVDKWDFERGAKAVVVNARSDGIAVG